jgi:hypothetical protein
MVASTRIAKSVRNPAIAPITSRAGSKLMRLSRYNVNSQERGNDQKQDDQLPRAHDLTRIRRKFVIKGEHFFV